MPLERLDRGIIDLVVKGIVAAAVGVLGYVANATVDRLRDLERAAQEAKDRAHRLELDMRTEMLSKAEFKEWMQRWGQK